MTRAWSRGLGMHGVRWPSLVHAVGKSARGRGQVEGGGGGSS